jgi:hypothetical protein
VINKTVQGVKGLNFLKTPTRRSTLPTGTVDVAQADATVPAEKEAKEATTAEGEARPSAAAIKTVSVPAVPTVAVTSSDTKPAAPAGTSELPSGLPLEAILLNRKRQLAAAGASSSRPTVKGKFKSTPLDVLAARQTGVHSSPASPTLDMKGEDSISKIEGSGLSKEI